MPIARLLALALTALALTAAPTHAQIGGLMKKAAKAAAAKALEKPGEKGEPQGAAAGGDDASQPRTEMDSLYAIVHPTSADLRPLTGELLDQFFRGYAEERALRARQRQCERGVYESAAWKKLEEEPAQTNERMEEVERLKRAQMLKACDVDMDALDLAEMRTTIAAAKASGLSAKHYAMVRERVLAFAALAAKYNTGNYGGYRFGAAEREALQARRASVDQVLGDDRQ